MSIELVTGHSGSSHVTSAQDGRLNAAIFGKYDYVLPLQSEFAITVDSANSVTVATGDAMMAGRHITSEAPTTLTVDSGTQGMKRNDIVCIVYSKSGSGVETASLTIVKGTETSGTPIDPVLPSGYVLSGDTTDSMALWRLPIDGITLGTPEQIFLKAKIVAEDTSGNYEYAIGYTASARRISLTGSHGGGTTTAVLPAASDSTYGLVKTSNGVSNTNGVISVPEATENNAGLLPASMYPSVLELSKTYKSDKWMGFGYRNASGVFYFYFPIAGCGYTAANVSRYPNTFDISCSGTRYQMEDYRGAGVTIGAALFNGGTLLQVSIEGSTESVPYRTAFTVYADTMSVTLS